MRRMSFGQMLTAYANLSFDAGRWSANPKTQRRYERTKERADRLRERIITQYSDVLLRRMGDSLGGD